MPPFYSVRHFSRAGVGLFHVHNPCNPHMSNLCKCCFQLLHVYVSFSGQVQLESLPHPVVVHLLPFFKLLASFLENCICQVDALSDKHYWMVKCLINLSYAKIVALQHIQSINLYI